MANEIKLNLGIGDKTIKAVIENAAGLWWDGDSFETPGAISAFATVTLAESPASSGRYRGTFPATIPAGKYNITAYQSPYAAADAVGSDDYEWDGSSEMLLQDIDIDLSALAAISNALALLNNLSSEQAQAAVAAALAEYDAVKVSDIPTDYATLENQATIIEGQGAIIAGEAGILSALDDRLPDALENGRIKATLSGEEVTLPDPAPDGYGGGGLTEEQAANIALIDDIAERVEEQVPGDDPVVIIPAPANPTHRAVVLDITKFGQGQAGSLEDRPVSAQLTSSYPAYVTEFLDSGYNDSGTTDEDGRYVFYLVPGYQYQFYIGGQRVKTGTVPNTGSGPFYVAQLS